MKHVKHTIAILCFNVCVLYDHVWLMQVVDIWSLKHLNYA
jgi:hypothetical protein